MSHTFSEATVKQIQTFVCVILKCQHLVSEYLLHRGKIFMEPLVTHLRKSLTMYKLIVGLIFM